MFDIDPIKITRPFAKEDHDETGHYYITKEGKRYTSITTIFKILDPFVGSENWNRWIEWISEENMVDWDEAVKISEQISKSSTDVGTSMHLHAEQYLSDKLRGGRYLFHGLEKDPYDLFLALKEWLDKNIAEVHATECKLYSDELEIAGTVDLVATLTTGEKVIIDFKNSRKPKTPSRIEQSHYYEQLVGYSKMWEYCTGESIDSGIVVVVSWDNKVRPFKINLEDYEDKFYDIMERYEKHKYFN